MLATSTYMARIEKEIPILGNSEKKKKRPPERKCGDWCEFLSSKGSIYYYHVKRGQTQWKKPETWDDTSVRIKP